MSEKTEVELLREAHAQHRQDLASLKGRITRLEEHVGVPRAASFGAKTLTQNVQDLKNASYSSEEAAEAIAQLRRLADAIYDIFKREEE